MIKCCGKCSKMIKSVNTQALQTKKYPTFFSVLLNFHNMEKKCRPTNPHWVLVGGQWAMPN